MKNLDGNESQMAVWLDKRFNSAQYNLSLGWVAFKQNNNISQGDECVFKYITSEDKMCLVKITKASATEVDDGMDVENDNDTNKEENVKLVDDADPFFVVTIIPSQRSVLVRFIITFIWFANLIKASALFVHFVICFVRLNTNMNHTLFWNCS